MKPARVLAAALATALTLAAQATFPIAGTMVDAATGDPVNRAHVVLTGLRGGEVSIVTASDGRFQFDVPAGKYGLFAERRGYRQTYGNTSPGEGFGSAVIAGPDQDTSNLVFKWFSPGSIFGRVIDDRGDPVERATIQLIRESVVVGRKRIANYNYAYTDDIGNYRLGPLPAGTYYLVVLARPWFVNMSAPLMQPLNPSDPLPAQQTYLPAFYPNTTNAKGAAPIVVKPGSEAQADFTLQTINGSHVRPVCSNQKPEPDPNPNPELEQNPAIARQMAALRASQANRCQGQVNLYLHTIGDMETYIPANFAGISGAITVPPGRYTVRYSVPNRGAMQRIIDVNGPEIAVDLAPLPQPTISGTVTLKNPSMQARGTIYVRLVNESTGSAIARAVDKDGTFSWNAVAPAKLRVQVSGSNPFLIDHMDVKGTTHQDGVLDITDGESVRLQIVATDETGRLRGFVKNGDKGVMAAIVVLVPRASKDLNDYRGFQTESDGSFDFQNVRAGDYLLFAVQNPELEYSNPEAMKPYLDSAKPVHIDGHSIKVEQIGLFSGPGSSPR